MTTTMRATRLERQLRRVQQQIANTAIEMRLARLQLEALDLRTRDLREYEAALRRALTSEADSIRNQQSLRPGRATGGA
jgi:hypothetical protein